MTDVAYVHESLGDCVISFDGHVVEHFTWQVGSAARLVVGLLHVEIDGPDRKGRSTITFSTRAGSRGGGFSAVVDDVNLRRLQPLVDEIRAAIQN